jgi:hypothetical protein
MAFQPEASELALFNLIKSAVAGLGLTTISRAPHSWGQVDASMQPALYLVPHGAVTTQSGHIGLNRWQFNYSILVYVRGDAQYGPDVVPQTLLNNILQNVRGVLGKVPGPGGVVTGELQTLGGTVINCWIDGPVSIDPCILDQQGGMLIPIAALTGD